MNLFLKNFSIYTLGGVFSKSLSLVILPFLTLYLTPGEFGKLEFLLLLGSFFYLVVNIGFDSCLSYYYINNDELNLTKDQVASFIFYIVLIWGGFTLIIVPKWILHEIFSEYSLQNIYIICLIFFLEFLIGQFLNIYRLSKKSKEFVVYSILSSILINGLTLIFLYLDYKILAVLYARLISNIIVFVLLIYKSSFKLKKTPIKYSLFLSVFSFSIPIYPQSFGSYLFDFTDKYLIDQNIGTEELGIYSATLKLTMIFVFFSSIFRLTILPDLLELIKKNLIEKIKKIYNLYFFFIHGIIIFSAIISPFLIQLFLQPKYYSLSHMFGLMIVYPLYSAGFNIASIGLWKVKKNHISTLIFIFCGILNFILTYYLISKFGIQGAVYSTSGVSVLWILLTIYYSNKYYPINISIIKQFLSSILFLSILLIQLKIIQLGATYIDNRKFLFIMILIFITYILIEFKLRDLLIKDFLPFKD